MGKERWKARWKAVGREGGNLALLLLGLLAFVVQVKAFMVPNRLLTGGVTGISLLFHALFGWPVGFLVFLLNVPIFFLGFRDIGRRFGFLSAVGVVGFWLVADFVPVPPATHDPMLAAVFGGVLGGVAGALALRSGGSLGGFDILGVVLNRRFSLGVGEAQLLLNGALIVAAGLLTDLERAMYTLVAIYAGGRTLDAIQAPRPRKAVLIVSSKSGTIRRRILDEMARGVTVFQARGAFTGLEQEALLCVITRYELKELRDLIRSEDPAAFVSVLEASDVIGRFREPSAFSIWKRQGRKGA
jgi:uncharacterized membrane-anchored protein YitT (DUF2179 family)